MKKRALHSFFCHALGVGLLACSQSSPTPDSRLAIKADFVFKGFNVLPRAATIDVDDVSNLAIVRVDEILAGGQPFQSLAGRQITVMLKDPSRAKAGQARVYYTNGWHWGDEIGVIEVGSVIAPDGPGLQAMRSDIERLKMEQADSTLAERLRSAELVVAGKVSSVRRSPIPRMASEHDPDWYEADIDVSNVLRGATPSKRVTILFPRSDDVMWADAPKFRVGDEGIWILHRLTVVRPLPQLTAIRPGDFRPLSDEARIRRLLTK